MRGALRATRGAFVGGGSMSGFGSGLTGRMRRLRRLQLNVAIMWLCRGVVGAG
jgi:hypothetical protein